ncbi:MAG TPA: phosphoenolpyruvate--protein phosphotransferase [Burkholderiales bacterium]|nr:phosphoenolpyruvate--protein phosphotransferase [Burkholderiales bacterium]
MSFTMHGIGVSEGIAIGPVHLLSHDTLEVAHYTVREHEVADEIARFASAIKEVQAELQTVRENMAADAPAELSAFLDLHQMILCDPIISKDAPKRIEEQHCNAEWALKQQLDELLERFNQIEDNYLRERKADVIQVGERVLKSLLGHPGHMPSPTDLEQNNILVAHDLSPAELILFKQHRFAAFITDIGGLMSHSAIVARSLNVPSIVALHQARQLMREQDMLVVDGSQGVVIVNPDNQILAEYKLRQNQRQLEQHKLKRLKLTRSTTLDGTAVELQANIELPQDIDQVKENGAMGIGLFRTEFLYMNRLDLPSEEEQLDAYRKVAQKMHGLPVTIRTLDLGADKSMNGAERGPNPALGLRAIRLCLAEPYMFHTQLRAIFRATNYGNIRILIPMLSSVAELNQTLQSIELVKTSLDKDRIPYNHRIEIGGMIEIPAAALALTLFLKKLDFLSIGTNDLIQYTLAIDRADDAVAHLYDPLHPAVLHLIAHTISTANKAGVPIAVCGEMAGDVSFTRLLLGLGLRQFSMHPAYLLSVKQQVLKTSLPDITGLTQKILKADEPDKVRELLFRLNS